MTGQESGALSPLPAERASAVVSDGSGTSEGSEETQRRFGCRCGANWTGVNIAHCPTCHRTFTRPSNFDRHRRGGECLDPASVGLVRTRERADAGSDGAVWSMPAQVRPVEAPYEPREGEDVF